MAQSKRKLSAKNKYLLYESSVQDSAQQIGLFRKVYRQAYGKYPQSLCEDFCGTFLISADWVKFSQHNTAFAIDLSREPLEYGKWMHRSALSREQSDRLRVVNGNVLKTLNKKYDVIAACNFSFYVFKERKVLLEYCKRSLKALNRKGAFVLEMVGGAGFIDAPFEEKRTVYYKEYLLDKSLRKKNSKAVYYWNHKSYEPINRHGVYSIDFKIPGNGLYRDCFVYDWRIWTIPEVKDCMLEVGFKDVHVYWAVKRKNSKDTDYERRKIAASDEHTWIAYVVGVK